MLTAGIPSTNYDVAAGLEELDTEVELAEQGAVCVLRRGHCRYVGKIPDADTLRRAARALEAYRGPRTVLMEDDI